MFVPVLHDINPSVIHISRKLLGEYIKLSLWTNALYTPKTGMLLGIHTGLQKQSTWCSRNIAPHDATAINIQKLCNGTYFPFNG